MYSRSNRWKENIYKNVQSFINLYIDDIRINSKYLFDFRKGGILFDGNFELGSTPSQYIEFKIKKGLVNKPKKIKVEYGLLYSDYSYTVEEINNMMVSVLNNTNVVNLMPNFETIPIGTYNVDDYNDNDGKTTTIKALDNMIKFDTDDGYYDASELIKKKGYATLEEIAQDICDKKGVELGSTSFLHSNKKIYVYDNEVTAREYISYIAEQANCFAIIGRDGKLYFRQIGQDEETIPLKLFKTHKFGEEYKISKVAYENGIESFKFGNNTRNTLWLNQENLFIVDEEQVQDIYNNIKDLTINSFEGTVIIDPAIDIGDKITIDGKTIIYQGEMRLQGRFITDIKSTISIKAKEETTTRKVSQKVINRRVQSRIDEEEAKITLLTEQNTENEEKISQLEVNLDGIDAQVKNNKIETDEALQTTKTELETKINVSAEGVKSEVNQTIATAKTEAINTAGTNTDNKLKNYSTTTQMNSAITQKANEITTSVSSTYITKSDSATNIANAKTDAINSANTSTDNKLKNYSTTTQMNSAIEQKADSITSTVESKITTAVENIEVGGRNLLLDSKREITNSTYNIATYTLAEKPIDGEDYTFSLKGNLGEGKTAFRIYNSGGSVMLGNLKYVESENIYKLTFPWKSTSGSTTVNSTFIRVYTMPSSVTVESSIEWVKLEKGNKNTDWTPAPEDTNTAIETAKSEIKQTTDSISLEVAKKVNNQDLTGANILLIINNDESEAKINADKIDIDGKAVHFKTNINTTIGPFTETDRQKVINYIMGKTQLTTTEFKKYDIDGDNKINSYDALIIKKAILNGGYYTFKGAFEIDPYSSNQTINIINNNNNVSTIISPLKNYFQELFVDNIIINNQFSFTDINGQDKIIIDNSEVNGENVFKFIVMGYLALQQGDFSISNGNFSMEQGNFRFKNGSLILGSNDNDTNKVNFDVYLKNDANFFGNLDVRGNVYANNISSDRRIKKNIKNSTTNALDIIKQIKHKQFEMKSDNKHYDIGYIAQEMEEIDPNFVLKKEKTENSDERYYINELPIIATATKAIQEQSKLIEEMQKEIETLKQEIKELKEEK